MPEEQEKNNIFTAAIIRTLVQDIITFCTLFAILVWPILNLAVFQPQADLGRRMDKMEAAAAVQNQALANIDKNLAVLAESMKAVQKQLDRQH